MISESDEIESEVFLVSSPSHSDAQFGKVATEDEQFSYFC